jgi:serine/threonine protein kinase
MVLTPGTRLGPYEIQAAIGAGGMGEVYLAHDTRLNRQVALKSLSGPSVDTPQARERLLREARAAAQLTHPNIAAIHDILDSGPCPCIVMEYVEGETLAAKIARGPLPCAQALSIGIQLADALVQAHGAGVIHRDLKPANVQVAPDGTAKILDFGIATSRNLEDSTVPAGRPTKDVARPQAGKLTGTAAYMAPEQLAGKPATPQSDVYALGVLLFEAISGRRPFNAADVIDLAVSILSDPTPTLRTSGTGTPPELSAVVARAMARKPRGRYPSAAAVAADLRRAARAISEQPTVVSPPAGQPDDLVQLVRRRLGRRRLLAALGVLAVLTVLALAAAMIWRSRPTRAACRTRSLERGNRAAPERDRGRREGLRWRRGLRVAHGFPGGRRIDQRHLTQRQGQGARERGQRSQDHAGRRRRARRGRQRAAGRRGPPLHGQGRQAR